MAVPIAIAEIDFSSLDLLPYGIIVLDAEGNVVFYNDREEQIAGRQRIDVLGRNFFTEVAPCTQVTEFYPRFKEVIGGDGMTAEFAFHFPFRPHPRDVEIAMTAFRVDDRSLCLMAIRDLTEAELIRDQILAAQRLAGVGEVAAGVAHNFNNVLMAMATWHTVLQQEMSVVSPRAKRAIEEIGRVVSDGRSMVARIRTEALDAPPADAGEADMNAAVHSALEQARARFAAAHFRPNTEVAFHLGMNLPHVLAPASELREVLVNIVSNAFEALQGDGRIDIATSFANGQVTVSVRDSGPGMPEEIRRRIFRPLFTTKGAKGTGLGLSTAYATIRRRGGAITFQTSLGEGTAFTITLPAAIASRHAATA